MVRVQAPRAARLGIRRLRIHQAERRDRLVRIDLGGLPDRGWPPSLRGPLRGHLAAKDDRVRPARAPARNRRRRARPAGARLRARRACARARASGAGNPARGRIRPARRVPGMARGKLRRARPARARRPAGRGGRAGRRQDLPDRRRFTDPERRRSDRSRHRVLRRRPAARSRRSGDRHALRLFAERHHGSRPNARAALGPCDARRRRARAGRPSRSPGSPGRPLRRDVSRAHGRRLRPPRRADARPGLPMRCRFDVAALRERARSQTDGGDPSRRGRCGRASGRVGVRLLRAVAARRSASRAHRDPAPGLAPTAPGRARSSCSASTPRAWSRPKPSASRSPPAPTRRTTMWLSFCATRRHDSRPRRLFGRASCA